MPGRESESPADGLQRLIAKVQSEQKGHTLGVRTSVTSEMSYTSGICPSLSLHDP